MMNSRKKYEKLKQAQEQMRKEFYRDMQVMKQREIDRMQYHNQRFLGKDDIVPI